MLSGSPGWGWQLDDLAGAVEDAAGPDVARELDALAGYTGHDEKPGEALRSGRLC
jgi:hypothetical protein